MSKRNKYKPIVPDTPPKVEPKLRWELIDLEIVATYSEFRYSIISVRACGKYNYKRYIKQLLIQIGNVQNHITGGLCTFKKSRYLQQAMVY